MVAALNIELRLGNNRGPAFKEQRYLGNEQRVPHVKV